MTNQFCHCEERTINTVSKQRSQKSGLICLVETTSSRTAAIAPKAPEPVSKVVADRTAT